MIDFIPDDGELLGRCHGPEMSGGIRSKIRAIKTRIKARATKAVKRHVNHPKTRKHVSAVVRQARAMGVDFDNPEMMGTWLQDIGKKIKGAIKKTKSVQFTTDRGTAKLGPEGVTWIDQQSAAEEASPEIVQASAGSGILKNPLMIGAAISLAALLLSKKKGR